MKKGQGLVEFSLTFIFYLVTVVAGVIILFLLGLLGISYYAISSGISQFLLDNRVNEALSKLISSPEGAREKISVSLNEAIQSSSQFIETFFGRYFLRDLVYFVTSSNNDNALVKDSAKIVFFLPPSFGVTTRVELDGSEISETLTYQSFVSGVCASQNTSPQVSCPIVGYARIALEGPFGLNFSFGVRSFYNKDSQSLSAGLNPTPLAAETQVITPPNPGGGGPGPQNTPTPTFTPCRIRTISAQNGQHSSVVFCQTAVARASGGELGWREAFRNQLFQVCGGRRIDLEGCSQGTCECGEIEGE
ncbi:MAG: hypothetical protein N2654_01855 [Deltaproteobacteria bacterium]|nr:hypothetical protein [Deltaproteobacteria bacterium]